jgi:hypothetical protein
MTVVANQDRVLEKPNDHASRIGVICILDELGERDVRLPDEAFAELCE